MTDWLPPLVLEEQFGGGYDEFIAAVYAVFRRDFFETRAKFRGKLVSFPPAILDRKEAGFWHLVTSGSEDEEERQVDFARCRYICWPRALLDAVGTDRVRTWRDPTWGRWRVCPSDFSYLLIVKEKTSYCRIVTAFPVVFPHQRRKYEKDYLEDVARGAKTP